MEKVFVEYNSNNSGGSWWLSDKDWKNLEKADWFVHWGGQDFHGGISFREPLVKDCRKKECPGHRRFNSWKEMKSGDRWLGALAKSASKEFNSISEAVEEWEKITKQSASDEGCNCCGSPHTFRYGKCVEGGCECKGPHKDMNYASGEDILDIKYNDNYASKSKEDLIKKLISR